MGFLSDMVPLLTTGAGAALGSLAGPGGTMAGASVGATLGSSFSSAQGVADTNDANRDIANAATAANAQQAQKQMDFQREMSNTAHQREVNDLIAAGLNPILSAGGGGASAPSGASGSAVTAQMQNERPDFSHAVTSALDALTAKQNLTNLKQQNENLVQQNHLTQQDLAKRTAETDTANIQAADAAYTQNARQGNANVPNYYKSLAKSQQAEFSARSTEARRSTIDNNYAIDHATLLNNIDTAQKGANVLSTGASIIKPWSSTTGKIKDNRDTHYHVNKITGELK